jgi:hypothetical protein
VATLGSWRLRLVPVDTSGCWVRSPPRCPARATTARPGQQMGRPVLRWPCGPVTLQHEPRPCRRISLLMQVTTWCAIGERRRRRSRTHGGGTGDQPPGEQQSEHGERHERRGAHRKCAEPVGIPGGACKDAPGHQPTVERQRRCQRYVRAGERPHRDGGPAAGAFTPHLNCRPG